MADMCVSAQAIVAVTHQEMWQSTKKAENDKEKTSESINVKTAWLGIWKKN